MAQPKEGDLQLQIHRVPGASAHSGSVVANNWRQPASRRSVMVRRCLIRID